jgi:hypothetical protein
MKNNDKKMMKYLQDQIETDKIHSIDALETRKLEEKQKIKAAEEEKSKLLLLPMDRCLFASINNSLTKPCVNTNCTRHAGWRQIRIAQVYLTPYIIEKADLNIYLSIQTYRTLREDRLRLLKEIKLSRGRIKKLLDK